MIFGGRRGPSLIFFRVPPLERMKQMKRWIRPALTGLLILGMILGLSQIPDPNSISRIPFEPLVRYTPAPPRESELIFCYVTRSGKKYHLTRSCSSLRSAKNILKISLDEAMARYQPCQRCAGE